MTVMLITLLLVGLFAGATVVLLAVQRVSEATRLRRTWRSLRGSRVRERFQLSMVDEVPEPARRYLLHAIQPGTLLASSVELKMKGRIRLSRKGRWMQMQAEEILAGTGGFVWKAAVGRLFRWLGSDGYAEGQGAVRWRLWGFIALAQEDGPNIARSARGRFVLELIWLPSALLPQCGAEWERVDEETARVTLQIRSEPMTLTLTIAPDGALRSIRLNRWGKVDTRGGSYQDIPFGGAVLEERRFGGYTIPGRIKAGWWANTDKYFEFIEAEIVQADYS